MLTYLQLALGLLKLVNYFLNKFREDELRASGFDAAIAEVTKQILVKTDEGKKIMEKVNAMPIEDVDKGLIALEPK